MTMMSASKFVVVLWLMVVSDIARADAPAEQSCPRGWTESEGSCFRYTSDGGTWAEGNLRCKELHPNATLATIENEAQTLAASKLVDGSWDAWIGKRLYNNGEYWMDGSCSTYSPGVEKPLTMSDSCRLVVTEDHQFFPKWGHGNCDLTRPSMCAFSMSGRSEDCSRGPSICPEGWVESEGRCFRYDASASRNWEGCNEFCKGLHPSATLATIENDAQNLAAAKLIDRTGDAWIGKKLDGDTERWKDGSTSTYSPGFEHGLWQDKACTRMFKDEHQVFPRWSNHNCGSTDRVCMCGFSPSSASSPPASMIQGVICFLIGCLYWHGP